MGVYLSKTDNTTVESSIEEKEINHTLQQKKSSKKRKEKSNRPHHKNHKKHNCPSQKSRRDINEAVARGDMFYFRNSRLYPMTIKCRVCGKVRFTPEQVKILSDKNLTKAYYDKHFGFEYLDCLICNEYNCKFESYKITNGNNFYHMGFAWLHFEAEEQKKKKSIEARDN